MLLLTTLLLGLPTAPQQPLAVLDDGTRVQVLQSVEIDSYLVRTPFGILRSEGQKVVELSDATREAALLEPLHDLDFPLWVSRMSERGLLQRLLLEPVDDGNRAILFDTLTPWGRRLDSLAPELARDRRVAELWKQMVVAKGAHLALFVGALEGEISGSSNGQQRRIGLSDWRQAMYAEDCGLRWAASRIAAVQQDPDMVILLLDGSLEDPDLWVARSSAEALLDTDPRGALYRWAYEMATNRSKLTQRRAAWLLGEFGQEFAELAQELAERLRASTFLSGSSSGRGSCSSPSGIAYGPSATDNSVLELQVPSTLMMLHVADILERVATSSADDRGRTR